MNQNQDQLGNLKGMIQEDTLRTLRETTQVMSDHIDSLTTLLKESEEREYVLSGIAVDFFNSINEWRQALPSSDPVGPVLDSLMATFIIRRDDCDDLPECVSITDTDDSVTFTYPTYKPGQYQSDDFETLTRTY